MYISLLIYCPEFYWFYPLRMNFWKTNDIRQNQWDLVGDMKPLRATLILLLYHFIFQPFTTNMDGSQMMSFRAKCFSSHFVSLGLRRFWSIGWMAYQVYFVVVNLYACPSPICQESVIFVSSLTFACRRYCWRKLLNLHCVFTHCAAC